VQIAPIASTLWAASDFVTEEHWEFDSMLWWMQIEEMKTIQQQQNPRNDAKLESPKANVQTPEQDNSDKYVWQTKK
jgi:hypothetical protein